MNSGGLGVGSVSIVLIFTVLCLTVFSLITFYVAGNDKTLADAKAEAVVSYYEADTRAEAILAEILSMQDIPDKINDTPIFSEYADDNKTEIIYFQVPISDVSAIYVNVARGEETYNILSWKMIFTDEWNRDDSLNLWPGTSN